MDYTKINYGIDLGTTNSAMAKFENGEVVMKKTDRLKDTMPSCIFINKKKVIEVGDSAYNSLRRARLSAMKNWDEDNNAFIEFKRTMGTTETYYSPALDRSLTSEELSAEVLKGLKSFIKDENVKAAVITIPAAFKNNQIDATRQAAKMAGIEHVEVLQEPVAAAIAYGLENANKKEGYWLVFDFGGGTFDAALLKADGGVMKVFDTEGDNYLGGKNLDFAMVDQIILPYLEENYVMDSILADDERKQILRNAMKFYAENAKIDLSFNETCNILSDLGDIPGEDDEGEEFELDIELTRDDLKPVFAPIFQKAIDICKRLLARNNLSNQDIASLILVGGPTYSSVLRTMLEEQLCKPEVGVDPMTVVARGAAIYASTVDVSDAIIEETRDKLKIQLSISHASTSVEQEEFVTVNVLKDKTEGEIPDPLFIDIVRSDQAWSSNKTPLSELGEIIDVQLVEGKTNTFNVNLYDEKGNLLECQPNQFSIIQGVTGIDELQVLPYNFGIEIYDVRKEKSVFSQVKGLEKNKSLPVEGVRNGLKTQQAIRPGNTSDVITIPLYQGNHDSEGSLAIYNEHVFDVKITGEELPGMLPEGSDVDLTIHVDRSQNMTVQAYFPYLDYTVEASVPVKKSSVSTQWLVEKIADAMGNCYYLKSGRTQNAGQIDKLLGSLNNLSRTLDNNPNNEDNKQQVLSELRGILKELDVDLDEKKWGDLEEKITQKIDELEQTAGKLNDTSLKEAVQRFKAQLTPLKSSKNMQAATALKDQLVDLCWEHNKYDYAIHDIQWCQRNFDYVHWLDTRQARAQVDKGIKLIESGGDKRDIFSTAMAIFQLMPEEERTEARQPINTSILRG